MPIRLSNILDDSPQLLVAGQEKVFDALPYTLNKLTINPAKPSITIMAPTITSFLLALLDRILILKLQNRHKRYQTYHLTDELLAYPY
ncbi:MAG TPA: hypothetical protein VMB52_06960 [Verrucomicrobiae bacterium]|nr:hypothetical protein [Verrucomicrobiae bacterium]